MINEYVEIAIGADHAGFELKEKIVQYLQDKFKVKDFGTNSNDSVNYPLYGQRVAKYVSQSKKVLGILVCGSAIGISIAANRYRGVRCAILYSDDIARLAKEHNNANIIAFGQNTMDHTEVIRRIDIFLATEFLAGRHLVRINQLDN